jgi:hypothetical protein
MARCMSALLSARPSQAAVSPSRTLAAPPPAQPLRALAPHGAARGLAVTWRVAGARRSVPHRALHELFGATSRAGASAAEGAEESSAEMVIPDAFAEALRNAVARQESELSVRSARG